MHLINGPTVHRKIDSHLQSKALVSSLVGAQEFHSLSFMSRQAGVLKYVAYLRALLSSALKICELMARNFP